MIKNIKLIFARTINIEDLHAIHFDRVDRRCMQSK